MKKYLFFILFSFLFFGCVSKPATHEAPSVRIISPRIEIELTADIITVTVSYSADSWAFINGVELKNGAGETIRYTFKNPYHKVMNDASILEICTIALNDYDIDGVKSTAASKLRAFVAAGDVTAQPIAERRIFDFYPVDIKAAN